MDFSYLGFTWCCNNSPTVGLFNEKILEQQSDARHLSARLTRTDWSTSLGRLQYRGDTRQGREVWLSAPAFVRKFPFCPPAGPGFHSVFNVDNRLFSASLCPSLCGETLAACTAHIVPRLQTRPVSPAGRTELHHQSLSRPVTSEMNGNISWQKLTIFMQALLHW